MTCDHSTATNNQINIFVTHGRGTYKFVETELLKANVRILDSIEGKTYFSMSNSLSIIDTLLSLKTVERVLFSILFHKIIGTKPTEESLYQIVKEAFSFNKHLFVSPEFNSIIQTTTNQEQQHQAKRKSHEIKFRVNCKLTGEWKANKTAARALKEHLDQLIARTVKTINARFELDLLEPHFEVICHVTNDAISIGVPISKKPLSVRSYVQHVGLRSTICSMMLQACLPLENYTFILGNNDTPAYTPPNYSQIILLFLDPFCGKSTILTEYLNTTKQHSLFISSDADPSQIQYSQENTRSLDSKTEHNMSYDLLVSNLVQSCSRLPYRDHIFDLILTDLPFEIKHAAKHFNSTGRSIFYTTVLTEFYRLLCQKTGKLVVLINSNEVEMFTRIVQDLGKENTVLFSIESSDLLSLGKTTAQLIKLKCQ